MRLAGVLDEFRLTFKLLTPFADVRVEYRVGVRRSTAQLEKLFVDGKTGLVTKDEFDREFPSSAPTHKFCV